MARSDNPGTRHPWRERLHIAPFMAIHCAQLRLMLDALAKPAPEPAGEDLES